MVTNVSMSILIHKHSTTTTMESTLLVIVSFLQSDAKEEEHVIQVPDSPESR